MEKVQLKMVTPPALRFAESVTIFKGWRVASMQSVQQRHSLLRKQRRRKKMFGEDHGIAQQARLNLFGKMGMEVYCLD